MYAYIKGVLHEINPSAVVIETYGIGYKVFIPAHVSQKMPQVGKEVILFTSFIVRELAHTLYGFLSAQERDFFDALLNVTGIGPKIALALIGAMPLDLLKKAIVNEEIVTLCKVPGIGKKGAERLIIEMRDKIELSTLSFTDIANRSVDNSIGQTVNDALSALINLGYNQSQAQKALKNALNEAPGTTDLAKLIALALKNV